MTRKGAILISGIALLLLATNAWAQQVENRLSNPHVVYGTVRTSEGAIPAKGEITFRAFITSRPEDVLTESSPGCGYEEGYWFVQCASFRRGWDIGETLAVHITHVGTGLLGIARGILTGAGSDNFDGVILPVQLITLTATVQADQVILRWETGTESNNYGFLIDRKAEGGDFQRVGFVPGGGASSRAHSYEFVDRGVPLGRYTYRLQQMDFDGSTKLLATTEVEIALPKLFFLSQPYPNPMNPDTQFQYHIPKASHVRIRIFNALGQKVATLVNQRLEPGYYHGRWDGISELGQLLGSGVYFLVLQAEDILQVRKIILMR